jgi:hypothetical protein
LRRHFDDDAIIELTAVIAFQNLSSKFNAALGVPPQGFCSVAPLPDEHRVPDQERRDSAVTIRSINTKKGEKP